MVEGFNHCVFETTGGKITLGSLHARKKRAATFDILRHSAIESRCFTWLGKMEGTSLPFVFRLPSRVFRKFSVRASTKTGSLAVTKYVLGTYTWVEGNKTLDSLFDKGSFHGWHNTSSAMTCYWATKDNHVDAS